ncbi:MAG: carbohydrate porin, partial [Acidobacteria bacterium]|nr:carbohydrate porin [Acidobacteriota bacterium]
LGVTLVGVAATSFEDPGGREIAIEAFHRFALTKWVDLKPDVQVIRTPLGTPGRRVMVAGTVRIEVVF